VSSEDSKQLNIISIAALAVSAIMLWSARGGYHPYAYYQIMRWVVSLSALLGAWRFAVCRWYTATAALIFAAILFNPISPIRMSRFQWHPYDFWAALGFLAFALLLGFRMRKMSSH